jgi:hypothetical protein
MTSRSGSCPFPSNQNRSPKYPPFTQLPHRYTRNLLHMLHSIPTLHLTPSLQLHPTDPSMPLPPSHQNKSGETRSKIPFKSSSRARAGVWRSTASELTRCCVIGPRSLQRYDYMRFLLCSKGMEGRCGVVDPRISILNP